MTFTLQALCQPPKFVTNCKTLVKKPKVLEKNADNINTKNRD